MRLLFLLLPSFLFCGDNVGTDIVPRTINFLIFFAFFVYLSFGHLKNLHKNRIEGIANRLKTAHDNVLDVKLKKEQAVQRLAKAKEQAESMIINAKEQDAVISKNMEEKLQKELLSLQQSYDHQKESMSRQVKMEVVDGIVEEVFNGSDVQLSQDELLKIIARKVS